MDKREVRVGAGGVSLEQEESVSQLQQGDPAVSLHNGYLCEAFIKCSSVLDTMLKAFYEYSHLSLMKIYERMTWAFYR